MIQLKNNSVTGPFIIRPNKQFSFSSNSMSISWQQREKHYKLIFEEEYDYETAFEQLNIWQNSIANEEQSEQVKKNPLEPQLTSHLSSPIPRSSFSTSPLPIIPIVRSRLTSWLQRWRVKNPECGIIFLDKVLESKLIVLFGIAGKPNLEVRLSLDRSSNTTQFPSY